MHLSLPFVSICLKQFVQSNSKFIATFFYSQIGPYGYSDFFDRAMGHLTPWSHVPHFLLTYGDDMTYFERVHNVIISLYDWYFRNWVMLEDQNKIAHKYFAHLAS